MGFDLSLLLLLLLLCYSAQVDVKIDSGNKLGLTVTNSSLAPGLKAVISGALPGADSGKLELKYANEMVSQVSQ